VTRLELRNIPAREIAESLLAQFGGENGAGGVTGEGWSVALIAGESAFVGRFRVPVLFVDVSGAREGEVVQFLRLKTMRGGG